MLLSHQHRFIFVHVSKAAGTSIQDALRPLADLPCGGGGGASGSGGPASPAVASLLGRVGVTMSRCAVWNRGAFREHATAAQICRGLPRGTFESYFTFAFVRNPWDWMVSLYAYLLNTPSHRHHARVRQMRGLREYIEFEAGRGKRSQHEFITDRNGRLLVDFVGRFETLHDDFADACRRIGIDAQLPHANASPHRDYRTYYRDSATIDLVQRHFARDIELLGYTFEGPASDQPRLAREATTARRWAAGIEVKALATGCVVGLMSRVPSIEWMGFVQ